MIKKTRILLLMFILVSAILGLKIFAFAQETGSPRELKHSAVVVLEKIKKDDKKLNHEIDKIIVHIEKSLEEVFWFNDWHLFNAAIDKDDNNGQIDWQQGLKVFQEEKKAIKRMLKDMGRKTEDIDEDDNENNDKPVLVPQEVKVLFEEIINNLVFADKLLAEIAIYQAKIYFGFNKEIDHQINKAEDELKKVNDKDIPDKVIEKYEKVWEHSQLALKHVTPEIAQQGASKWLLEIEKAFAAENQENIFAAAAAIEEIGGYSIGSLIEAIKDKSKPNEFRAILIELLSNVGDETMIATLIEILKNETNPRLRESSAIALGVIGPNSATEALVDSLKSDTSTEVKQSAALSLGSIKDERAISPLINALSDEDSMVRTNALRALGDSDAAAAIPEIIKKLDDSDAYVRYTAAQILGKIGNESVVDNLLLRLYDEDDNVRKSVIDAITNLVTTNSTAIVPSLIEAINDIDSEVGRRAAEALIKIGAPAVPDLLSAYATSGRNEREHIAYALGNIGNPQAIEILEQTLPSDNKSDALNAAIALYRLGLKDEMYDFALNLLSSEKMSIRESAAIALGEMGDIRAVEALEAALQDTELFVRDAASVALEKITGKTYEYQH